MLSIFPFFKKQETITENNNEKVEEVQQPTNDNPAMNNSIQTPSQEVVATTPVAMVNESNSDTTQVKDPNRKRVLLVVDDNKLNLRVASKLLSDFNCEIETVQSGKECLEKVQENNKYDLIFMDIMMPDMNGVETMHKLKSMENFHIPVVSLTADAVEGSREKYLGEGFDDYIPKPMNRDEMREAINKYIDLPPVTDTNNNNNIDQL